MYRQQPRQDESREDAAKSRRLTSGEGKADTRARALAPISMKKLIRMLGMLGALRREGEGDRGRLSEVSLV